MENRVVITGLGAVSPIGSNVNDIWTNCQNGVCAVAPFSDRNGDEIPVSLAAAVPDEVLEAKLEKREIRFASRATSFARIAAKEAYEDANLSASDYDPLRVGVMISSSIGGGDVLNRGIDNDSIGPFFIPGSAVHSPSAMVALDLDLHGINYAPVSACAGGANAIGEAYLRIKSGTEDIMLAGGSDSALSRAILKGFAAMRALYTGEDVSCASVPFDAERKGFVPGEGAAVVVLESLEHAKKRGAGIYAELVGYGYSNDANHQTAPREDGKYAALAMEMAMKDANLSPDQISYINAHGTGTRLNDLAECTAIKEAFRDSFAKPYVSSVKSMTGHMLSASAALEAVISVKALEDGFIPATVNTKTVDENCNLNLVKEEGIKADIDYVMSNSFGFGGFNAVLIFAKK